MKILSVAIIGLGHVAVHHMQAIAATSGMRFVGASDLDMAKRTILPDNIPFYEDPREMLSNLKPDLVIVAVPNRAHEEMTRMVLEKGLDVIVEKPIAEDLTTIDSLFALAEKSGARLIPVLHAAYGREVLWLEKALANGEHHELGPVTGFYCGFYDPYVSEGKLLDCASNLQGSWIDSAINALSVVGRFVHPGDLNLIELTTTSVPWVGARDVHGSGIFNLRTRDGSTGGLGVVDTNWTLGLNRKRSYLHFGRSGATILLDHSAQTVRLRKYGQDERSLADLDDGTHRLTAHYKGFFSQLVSGRLDRYSDPDHVRKLHSLCLNSTKETRCLSQ